MEAASDIRQLAFLGDCLLRQCGIATFTPLCLPPCGGNFCEPKPGLGQGGKAKGKAGD